MIGSPLPNFSPEKANFDFAVATTAIANRGCLLLARCHLIVLSPSPQNSQVRHLVDCYGVLCVVGVPCMRMHAVPVPAGSVWAVTGPQSLLAPPSECWP